MPPHFKPKILTHDNFDVNQVEFCNFKKKGNNNYLINLLYNKKKIYLKTPYMQTPFGVTKFINDDIKKFCLNLSFFGEKYNEDISNFKDIFVELDEMIYDNFIDNEEWLKKANITNEDVKKSQIKTIKRSKDNYPSYLNLKLLMDYKKSNIKTKFYDDDSNEIDIDCETVAEIIPPKSYVRCIIEVTGIWIFNKQFGLSLQPKQFLIKPNEDYYFNQSLFN